MSFSKTWSASAMLLLAMLSLLSGCASTPTAAPQPIAQCPKPGPLPAAISLISTQPSTATLSQASQWLERSGVILNGETRK